MMRWLVTRAVLPMQLALGLLSLGPIPAVAQDDYALAMRRPRFLRAPAIKEPPIEIDVRSSQLLRRVIGLDIEQATVGKVLDAIERQTGIKFIYSRNLVAVDRPVRVRAERITVAGALTELLIDTGIDVLLQGDHLALVERSPKGGVHVGAIVGRVTDAKTEHSLSGTEVLLEGTAWRTVTDTSGWYRLMDVEVGAYTLIVRRFGHAKQSRSVTVREGQTDTVNVTMEPQPTRLNELVTTATGRQRRLDIANDVTTINADSVMQVAPIRSVTDLLETRVPGLSVQRTSGAPGDPSRLRLRGASSILRNNDPIVIVDGVRVYAEQSAARSGNLARNFEDSDDASGVQIAPSPLDYIDPNIIETIEVLKGPSAATLYGQDAANGVIVITTKKGRPGPTRWNATVEHGKTQMAGEYPELLYRWGHLVLTNAPVQCTLNNRAFETGGVCVGDSLVPFQLLNDPALTILDQGHRTTATLGASGGSAALTYSITGSYGDEVGLVELPAYEAERYQTLLNVVPPEWMRRPQRHRRWGVTSRVGAQLGPTADVSLSASVSGVRQQKSTLQSRLPVLMSTYLDRSTGIYYYRGSTSELDNVFEGYFSRVIADATQFTNVVNLQWRPQTWLTLTGDAGLNLIQRADERFTPRVPLEDTTPLDGTGLDTGGGFVGLGQGRSLVTTVNLRANATAPLGRGFQLRVAAGANYAGTSIKDLSTGTSNLLPSSTLRGESVAFLNPAVTSDATFGWYVEPSMGNSKFNVTAGLRLDGGSSYGASVNSGFSLPKFPKLGFSYLASDETWFPLKNVIQSFRVRVAYGRASRQPGPKDRLRLYGVPGLGFVDGEFEPSNGLVSLGNTEVRPERSAEIEGGFDADLLDSRVTISATGYRKTTDDALLRIPVAPSVNGAGMAIAKNIGVTRNTGLELMVGAQVVRSGPVTWGLRMHLSQRRDLLVKLAPGVEPFYPNGGPSLGSGGGLRIVPGYPINGRWSRPILGYADANGNNIIDLSEVQLGDTAVFLGGTLPDYEMALSTTVSLWNGAVDVNASLSYQDGLSQRNDVAHTLSVFSAGRQDPASSHAEQVAMMPSSAFANLGLPTDYNWIQTVSTTRFHSLGVRYSLPAAAARRLGAQRLSVSLQASNLALWTNYRGLDPNVNAFGTGNNVTDTGILPQPRTWQVRVQATY